MRKKIDIGTKVEQAMQSIEGTQRASPGAFFYTRVTARLLRTKRSVWEKASAFIARPVIAMAVVCLVLLMNGIVVLQQKEVTSSSADLIDQNMYDEDFVFASNTFYDYEITEP